MGTYSGNFSFDHQTDEGFRAWVDEVTTRLAAVGLVQTADTGQIDTATVTRPATNTEAGFQIWRFNDAMQATAPVFIRIGYGTAGVATRPSILVAVGKGSNGSGNLTDVLFSTRTSQAGGGSWTGTSRQSLYCHAEGALSVVVALDAAASGLSSLGFIVIRTSAANGDPDGVGLLLGYHNNQTSTSTPCRFISARYSNSWVSTAVGPASNGAGSMLVIPGSTADSRIYDADTYIMPIFIHTERYVRPSNSLIGAKYSDMTYLSPFTVTPFGSLSRTYLPIYRQLGALASFPNDNAGGEATGCIVWE